MNRWSHLLSRLAPALVVAGLAVPAPTVAQVVPGSAASVPASAKLEILQPLTLQKRQDLDFGIVLPGTTTGTVYVRNDDTVTTSGGSGPRAAGGTPHHAEYRSTGGRRLSVLITSDVGVVRLRRAGGGAPDIAMNFGPPNALPQPIRVTFDLSNAGIYTFTLGATITVAGGQPEGDYDGSFNLTAAYF